MVWPFCNIRRINSCQKDCWVALFLHWLPSETPAFCCHDFIPGPEKVLGLSALPLMKELDHPANKQHPPFGNICFPAAMPAIRDTEKDSGLDTNKHPNKPANQPLHCVECTIEMSINLGNASHYDVHDAFQGFSIWTEMLCGLGYNWYFVMPNLYGRQPDGSTFSGTAGKLLYGVAISWWQSPVTLYLAHNCTQMELLTPKILLIVLGYHLMTSTILGTSFIETSPVRRTGFCKLGDCALLSLRLPKQLWRLQMAIMRRMCHVMKKLLQRPMQGHTISYRRTNTVCCGKEQHRYYNNSSLCFLTSLFLLLWWRVIQLVRYIIFMCLLVYQWVAPSWRIHSDNNRVPCNKPLFSPFQKEQMIPILSTCCIHVSLNGWLLGLLKIDWHCPHRVPQMHASVQEEDTYIISTLPLHDQTKVIHHKHWGEFGSSTHVWIIQYQSNMWPFHRACDADSALQAMWYFSAASLPGIVWLQEK